MFHVDAFGADPSGVTFSDAAVAAAREELGDEPGMLIFGVGTYKLNDGLNVVNGTHFGLYQGVEGQGAGLTRIEFVGQGAAIEVRNTDWEFNTGSEPPAGVHKLTISGWGNSNTATYGLRYGDVGHMTTSDLRIVGFNKANSAGLYADNQIAWSERANLQMSVEQCTICYLFEGCMPNAAQSLGTSFDYSTYDLSFVAVANQDGLVLRSKVGGLPVTMNGVDLRIVGNCVSAPVGGTNTGAIMRIGRDNSDPAYLTGQLSLNVETSGTVGGVTHIDFWQGAGPKFSISSRVNCTGSINLIPFSGTNFRLGTATEFSFKFAGKLRNCPSLGTIPGPFQTTAVTTQARARYSGADTNAVQMVYVKNATAGTFRLNFGGTYTSDLPYNVSASALKSALEAIAGIGSNNVTVIASQPRFTNGVLNNELAFGITFVNGKKSTAVPTFTADTASLTGTVDVVVRNTGSANPTYKMELETGNIVKIEEAAGTYRLALELGTLTDQVGVPRDSLFGLSIFDIWIKQPTSGGNFIIEGPWFPGNAASGSTYNFQWFDGVEPVLSTTPDAYDVLRLSTFNFNTWVGQHVTRKANAAVPASASSPGVPGQKAFDATYEYTCIAPNTWVRASHSSW